MVENLFEGNVPGINKEGVTPDSMREKIELYEMLVQFSPDVIWIMDTQQQTIYMSPSVFTNLGFTIEEYLKLPLAQRLPEASLKKMQEILRDEVFPVLKGKKPQPARPIMFEMLHKHKDGHLVWGEIIMNFIRNDKGEITSILGITRNIDKRKRVQEELAESRKHLETIVDSSSDWIWEIDANDRFVFSNTTVEQFLGKPLHEILGTTPYEHISPDTLEQSIASFKTLKDGRLPLSGFTQTILDAAGRKVLLDIRGNPFWDENGDFAGYRGICRDISASQSTRRKLQKLEIKQYFLSNHDNTGFIELDENFEILDWNAGATEIFGCTYSDAMLHDTFIKLWKPNHFKEFQAVLRRSCSENVTLALDTKNLNKQGHIIPCRWQIMPVLNELRQQSGSMLYIVDKTKADLQDKMLEALSFISEQFCKAILVTDAKMNIVYASLKTIKWLGIPEELLFTMKIKEIYTLESAETIIQQGIPVAKKRQNWEGKLTIIKGDKSQVVVPGRIVGIPNSKNSIVNYAFCILKES